MAAASAVRPSGVHDFVGPGGVVVIAPHPDDESLGCGGLLAQCFDRGRPCRVVLLTDGAHSNPNSVAWPPERIAAARAAELDAALETLGAPRGTLVRLDQTDGAASHPGQVGFEAALEAVMAAAGAVKASAILATWAEDPHPDHIAAAALAQAAATKTGARYISYPIWSRMRPPEEQVHAAGLTPLRLDITAETARKAAAIRCHATQLGGAIEDDPVCLPPEFLARFADPFELFFRHEKS